MRISRRFFSALGLAAVLLSFVIFPAAAEEMPDHIHVNVDVKPGSYPNVINLKSKGLVPVALLGGPDFSVSAVDGGTVGFGRMHEAGAAPIRFAFEDVNLDGFMDMVFKFEARATGLQPGDIEACLHGMLLSGEHFCGHDAVIVIG